MRTAVFVSLFIFSSVAFAVENNVTCSFKQNGQEFATRTLSADSNASVIEGFFVIENEYLHYRLWRQGDLGLRVTYAGEKFERFYSFGDGTDIGFADKIDAIDVSFNCKGTWTVN
jgi:hypothetical protein